MANPAPAIDLWPAVSAADGADHALICEAARKAGAIASDYFKRGLRGWDKHPGDPVSEADFAVDDFLRRTLLEARPDYGWVSEESVAAPGKSARSFVVDPIDGTRSFLKGRREYAVAVALVSNGLPVAAAVFNPETREFFEAVAGAGARLNGSVIAVARNQKSTGIRLLVSWREFQRLGEASAFIGCEMAPIGSIAYKIALVASGQADAVVALSPKSDWDLAAAHLVLTEAGGRITDGTGAALRYQGRLHESVLAASPVLHGQLLARLSHS